GPEPAAAEPESADLPLWDWSPPAERSAHEPSAGEPSAGEPSGAEPPAEEPSAARADPPKPEWRPVVRPAGEAAGGPQPGIGQRGGGLAQLAANPRMRIWQLRVVV